MLTGKDREQLHTIAGAMGVKAATRMRKADLIDAILAATGDGRDVQRTSRKRRRRSRAGCDRRVRRSSSRTRSPRSPTKRTRSPRPPRPTKTRCRAHACAARHDRPGRHRDRRPADAPSNGAGPGRAPRLEHRATEPHDDDADDSATERLASTGDDSDTATTRHGYPGTGGTAVASIPTTIGSPYGDGNRRGRRRRRGRGGQEQPQGGGEPRQVEYQGDPIDVTGLLDLRDEGYGFLRAGGYLPGPKDVYVSASQVRRFALRKGDLVARCVAPAGEQREVPGAPPRRRHQRSHARRRAQPPEVRRPHAAVPRLEAAARARATSPHEMTGRIVDLISPVGQGPARAHRVAAEGRQDHHPQAARVLGRAQQSRKCTSWCCSSTSVPKKSPTCVATCCAARWSRARSTVPPTSTRRSPSSRSSARSDSSRWAPTS